MKARSWSTESHRDCGIASLGKGVLVVGSTMVWPVAKKFPAC